MSSDPADEQVQDAAKVDLEQAGWIGRLVPLTVDGLIYTGSMVMLDSATQDAGSRIGAMDLAVKPILGHKSSAGGVYVSALTYCTTMTTCPSGLSVTVYQMAKPSDGR